MKGAAPTLESATWRELLAEVSRRIPQDPTEQPFQDVCRALSRADGSRVPRGAALHNQRAWAMVAVLSVHRPEALRIITKVADDMGELPGNRPITADEALELVTRITRLANRQMKAS